MSKRPTPNLEALMARQAVRMVPCPTCGAPAYEKCLGVVRRSTGQQSKRQSSHQARWDAYRARTAGPQSRPYPTLTPI